MARLDAKKDAKRQPDRLMESVGLCVTHLAKVVENLQVLAEKKGEEAEMDVAAKASADMKAILSAYGVASKLVGEKVKRPSTRTCKKKEGSGSSSAASAAPPDDSAEGDGRKV